MTNEELRTMGKAYLQCQRARVACELQIQKMLEHKLVQGGAAVVERLGNGKEETNGEGEQEQHSFRKTKLTILSADLAKKITDTVKASEEYGNLIKYRSALQREELNLLVGAEKVFNHSELWQFCEHVKGLGPVAAMTFFTILDTDRIADNEHGRVVTAGKIWKYLGLVPGQRLVSGQQGGYNAMMKGRLFMIRRNVIMANDPYYATIYRIQKQFYQQRPDLVAANGYTARCPEGHYVASLEKLESIKHQKQKQKKSKAKKKTKKKEQHAAERDPTRVYCPACKEETDVATVEDHRKRPGWKIWIDLMASRWMGKLLLSHVTEIIATAEGYNFSKHSDYIPPKPEFPQDQERVLAHFRESRMALLQRYLEQFALNGGNAQAIRDNMQSYWQERRIVG